MAKDRQTTPKEEPIEKQLWKSADKLRKNIDAAECKTVKTKDRIDGDQEI